MDHRLQVSLLRKFLQKHGNVKAILTKQQNEVEGLLNRLTSQLRTKKERLVFQVNNYDIILTVLDVGLCSQPARRC